MLISSIRYDKHSHSEWSQAFGGNFPIKPEQFSGLFKMQARIPALLKSPEFLCAL